MQVQGERPPISRKQWALMISVLLPWVLWSVTRGDVGYLVGPLLVVANWAFRFCRPLAIVSGDGIRRPWRRPGFIGWDEVDTVARPEPAFRGVRLLLVNGKTRSLADIPSARSADVAAAGGKELTLPPVAKATPRTTVRGDVEIEADVRRQAAALAEHRRAMKAQSDALHWKP